MEVYKHHALKMPRAHKLIVMKPILYLTSELIGPVKAPQYFENAERIYISINKVSNITIDINLLDWKMYNGFIEMDKSLKLEFSNFPSNESRRRSLVLYVTMPDESIAWHIMKQDGSWEIEERYMDQVANHTLREHGAVTI